MSKNHVRSLTYDQNVSENSTECQKNTSKQKNNAEKTPKMAKMSENTIKMDKKRQKGIGNHQIMARNIVKTCYNDQNLS